MKRILSIFFFIMFAGIVFSQNLYSVKYTIEKEHIVLPANIEGHELHSFMFDTGCAITHLTNQDLIALNKSGVITENDFLGTVNVVGMTGQKAIARKYNVRCLNIGKMKIHNVTILFNDTSKRTLGYNVIKRFDKISIDIMNKTIDFAY